MPVLAAGSTEFNVDFSDVEESAIGNPFNSTWIYDPYESAFYGGGYLDYTNQADNYYSDRYPWSTQIQLFQLTGGSDLKDFFEDPNDKTSDCDYSRAWTVLDTLLDQGVIPMIKLGSVPKAFVSSPAYGAFDTQLRPPDAANWSAYYTYLYDFIDACDSRYADAETWRWCIWSEGNNWDWFKTADASMTTTKNEFCKIYDYSVAAVKAVFGSEYSNVGVHFVADTVVGQCWDPDLFFQHCETGTNYYTSSTGSDIGFVEFSCYEPNNASITGAELLTRKNYLKTRAENRGFTSLEYGVGESWLLGAVEGGSSDIWSRALGSVAQNSYDAVLYKSALDNNISWLSNTDCGINNGDSGTIDAPYTVVMSLMDKMKNGKRATVTKSGTPASGSDVVDCVSTYDASTNKMFVLLYNHNPSYTATTTEDVTVNINNVQAFTTGNSINIKEYNVNESNMSWWKSWWDGCGSDAPRIGGDSKYCLCLWGSLSDTDDQDYFNTNKSTYQSSLALTCSTTFPTVTNNSFSKAITLGHHGVTLLQISNIKPKPELLTNTGIETTISPWSNANGGNVTRSSTYEYAGSYSARTSSRTGVTSSPTLDIKSILESAGQGSYDCTAYAKLSSGSDTAAGTVIKIVDSAGTHYTNFATSAINTTFAQIGGTADVTWTGTLTSALLYEKTNTSTTTLYLDEFSFRKNETIDDLITDELSDWTKVYSRSADTALDTSSSGSFNGDTSRAIKTVTTPQNIIYYSATNITYFESDTYFWLGEAITHNKFYTSPDDSTYTEVFPSVQNIGGDWKKIKYCGTDLPAGTKYVKVEFNNATANTWNPQIARVVISG